MPLQQPAHADHMLWTLRFFSFTLSFFVLSRWEVAKLLNFNHGCFIHHKVIGLGVGDLSILEASIRCLPVVFVAALSGSRQRRPARDPSSFFLRDAAPTILDSF